MEFLTSAFVWFFNFIESKKAHAIGLAFLGVFVSFILLKISPLLFKVAFFFSPNFQIHILNHDLVYNIMITIICLLPAIFLTRTSYYWLIFIYEQEARRRF